MYVVVLSWMKCRVGKDTPWVGLHKCRSRARNWVKDGVCTCDRVMEQKIECDFEKETKNETETETKYKDDYVCVWNRVKDK